MSAPRQVDKLTCRFAASTVFELSAQLTRVRSWPTAPRPTPSRLMRLSKQHHARAASRGNEATTGEQIGDHVRACSGLALLKSMACGCFWLLITAPDAKKPGPWVWLFFESVTRSHKNPPDQQTDQRPFADVVGQAAALLDLLAFESQLVGVMEELVESAHGLALDVLRG